MKKIYQVVNKHGNPAGREGNEDAIFLYKEKAQEHINFLVNICGLYDGGFKINTLNDFEEYHETHFEIVKAIVLSEDIKGSTAQKIQEQTGTGGLYDLAKELTYKFETAHKNIIWGEDLIYQDEIEKFLDKEL